jgi:hypothetical protein
MVTWSGESSEWVVCRGFLRRTRGTGDDRDGKSRWKRRWCLRYKMSAPLKHLKSLRNLKNRRKVRYKMSGAINPLF